jgi:EEF1A lysine methyltransferase 4
MSGNDADRALSTAEYWNDRYAEVSGPNGHVHEWLATFADLESFLDTRLFTRPGSRPEDNPLILHLGSGDSVSSTTPPGPFLTR